MMNPSIVSIGGFFLSLSISLSAFAAPLTTQHLSAEPTWKRLLHVPQNRTDSEVTTQKFFLSAALNRTPEGELNSTLTAFSKPFFPASADNHAICKFPARYIWLKKQGAIAQTINPTEDCPKFSSWIKAEDLESISLVLVTGYLGNPASTFGHILLKIDNSETISNSDLLNQSANYGAIVPDGESGILYTIYGLFGGYKAGFTAKEVYQENHIYLDKELRDMWEYKLNLDSEQRLFLAAHLWELLGKQFDYYFVDENCAYKMGELIELATEKEIVSEDKAWHIPADIFHAMEREHDLIDSIQFIPSLNRIVIGKYERLTDEGRRAFVGVINRDKNLFNRLDIIDKQLVSTALVDYYQYKIFDDYENRERYSKKRNYWLLRGIELPVNSHAKEKHYTLKPPTSGSRSSLFNMTLGSNSDDENYVELGGAIAFHDSLSLQTGKTPDTEFVAFDLSARIYKNRATIRKFRIAKVTKFITDKTDIFGGSKFSWSIDVGFMNDEPYKLIDGFYIKGGLGQSRYFDDYLAYTFVDMIVQRKKQYKSVVGFDWRVGVIIPYSPKFTGIIEAKQPINTLVPERTHIEVRHSYAVNKNNQFRVELYSTELNNEAKLSYLHHWF